MGKKADFNLIQEGSIEGLEAISPIRFERPRRTTGFAFAAGSMRLK
jgi:hypothetical protein